MSGTLDVRPYGRTGEQATAIGLGGGNLSKHSHDVGVATVRRALELGITYFDTSPAYGRGASQLVLGEALEGWQGKYMLATKLGYLATPGDFRSLESLRSQLRENLRALRRNRVDVLQLHVAELACWWHDGAAPDELVDTSGEFDFTNAPAMQVLAEAKEQGVCRLFGITGDEADELSFVLDHVDVDVCLLAYNYTLLSRRALERMMPLAREKGAAFVAAGILKTGFIQVHPEWLSTPPDWVTPEVRDRLKMLYDVQRESGLSILSLAIRYIIGDPDVATVLVGAATPAEVEDSVAAAEEGPLPADIKRAVDELGISTKGDPRAA